MPETNLERLLHSIGLEKFVVYYEEFKNLAAKDVVALLHQKEQFTPKSCSARTSKARRIFREGREAEALRLIFASSKVKPEVAEQARKLLTKLDRTQRSRLASQEDVCREARRLDEQGEFNFHNIQDTRKWVLTSIARRQGQPAFRATLLRQYGGSCAISGSRVEAVLEAAHIFGYMGRKTNHPKNGILLRSDLHTLFDLRLIAVDTTTMTVLISPELKGSSYEKFAGKKLKLPQEDALRPSEEALNAHRKKSGL